MHLEKICQQVLPLVNEVGKFIHSESQNLTQDKVQFKGRNDLVTYVDTNAEKRLVAGLHKIVPNAGFLTEENTTAVSEAPLQWVIDPLDGTTNYVHGLPFYAISVALMKSEKVVLGVVYEITLDECFYAWEDSPARLNGKDIHVSETSSLQNSLLATGFPYSNLTRLDPYLDLFQYLLQNSQGIRRLGSAATDLAYVACGRFEAFYEYSLKPWDVAAGSLIIQQAGGKVSDFKGASDYIFGQEIVSGNRPVHEELLKAVQLYFPTF
jgi:myo-inositol-1(or 4)-monophosphatase